ncbi:unnamed protein product [Caenorhabditis brenneri]
MLRMDSMSLEERAADYLKSKGINSLFPTFRGSSVIGASRMKVKVAATMDELRMGVDEMSHMFARLGHLVSKSTWMLQENPCDADDVIVQNHLHYVQHDDPPEEHKVIHITAKADRITNGRHHVSFRIVKFDGRREVLIGSGHSTLEILHRPPPPSTIASVVLVASLGGEANPKAAKPASIAPLPALPSATAAAAAPTIASPAHSTIAASSPVTASAAPTPPLSASAPQAPPARPRALSSILGRRSDPLRKRVRHVSFGTLDDDVEKIGKYMLVNVQTSHPRDHEKLYEITSRVGVPRANIKNITTEMLPIKKCHRVVYFFEVQGDVSCSKVENLIDSRKWNYKFSGQVLCSEDPQPFVFHALPMASIIEACLLGRMVGHRFHKNPSSYVLRNDLQERLENKAYLGSVLKDDAMTKDVLCWFNRAGRQLFNSSVKPHAIY